MDIKVNEILLNIMQEAENHDNVSVKALADELVSHKDNATIENLIRFKTATIKVLEELT